MSLRFHSWTTVGEGGVSVEASGGLLRGALCGEPSLAAGPRPGFCFDRVLCRGLQGKSGSRLSEP